jgi:hypothetical protein
MSRDTQIEGLEEIASRNGFGGSADLYCLKTLLADPAILAHIPAVKALQEENERLKEKLESQELSTRLAVAAMNKVEREGNQRIATLEAQLAGGEAVATVKRNAAGQIYMVGSDGNSFDISKHVGDKLYTAPAIKQQVADVDWLSNVIRRVDGNNTLGAGALAEKIVEAMQSVSANQPDSGKVPSGYALVPVEPNKGALIGEFQFSIERSCSACSFHGVDEDCEVCGGEVEYREMITVPWTTTKEIIAAHMSSAAPVDSVEAKS